MEKIYKFYVDCGRMGDLEGIFIADEEEVNKIMGRNICFYEVLGKHSAVNVFFDHNDIKVLTDDQDFIKKFKEITEGRAIGVNPLHYIEEEDDN